MKLTELLKAYEFDEIMPAITEMFPGTGIYRKQLEKAYNMIIATKPIITNSRISYKILNSDDGKYSYFGANDTDFNTTWAKCLGKDIVREHGVDLSEIEILANALVNLCFISKHPDKFNDIYKELKREI